MRTLPTGRILATRRMRRQILRQAHCGQHLRLLRRQIGSGERNRLLHRRQRHKLQQMVLDDVTRRADTVVIAGTTRHADILGMRDLHVVDVIVVPDRLIHRVRETKRQNILHRLLTEIMIDTEHAGRVEHLGNHTVEFLGAGQIVAKRLFDDHTTPSTLVGLRQTAIRQLARYLRERARRHRHVERMVASRATIAVELGDGVRQSFERLRIVERALHETNAVGELFPCRLLEWSTAVRLHVLLHEILEVILGPITTGKPRQTEAWRQ